MTKLRTTQELRRRERYDEDEEPASIADEMLCAAVRRKADECRENRENKANYLVPEYVDWLDDPRQDVFQKLLDEAHSLSPSC